MWEFTIGHRSHASENPPISPVGASRQVPGGARSGLHPEKQTVSCTSKGKIYPHDSAMSLQGKTPGRELLYILQIFCYYRRKALYHESLVRSPFRSRAKRRRKTRPCPIMRSSSAS